MNSGYNEENVQVQAVRYNQIRLYIFFTIGHVIEK